MNLAASELGVRCGIRACPRALYTLLVLACAFTSLSTHAQEEPALPPGLEQPRSDEPSLPPGLGGQPGEPDLPAGLPGGSDEPGLPPGLGGPNEAQAADDSATSPGGGLAVEFGGFVEGRLGTRLGHDPHEKTASIGEARFQLQTDLLADAWTARVVTDLLYDPVVDRHEPNLETGEGLLDLREAWVTFSAFDNTDVKVGRQIMTWGTGDLLFINDLFPKDWNSFFIGRDEDYLKAPNDAVRVNVYTDLVNIDVGYVPNFDADRFLDGRRLSYFNPALGRRAGRDAVVLTDRPNRWFQDDELHLRLHRRFGAYEVAAYGYHGFWKSPAGQSATTGRAIFPRLNVVGASVRGPVAGGIGNAEVGFYDSAQDRGGGNALIDNSQLRYLVGLERELATDLTLGMQYYVEHILQHDGYRASLPPGVPARDEFRHLITARLTYQMLNQNLILSLFGYVSPTDRDTYLRPNVTYKVDDHWTASVGANVFIGAEEHTFFGQLERNTNLYVSMRYSF